MKKITAITGHSLLVKEAKRVVAMLPQMWLPAKDKNGKPMQSTYTVPIYFRL